MPRAFVGLGANLGDREGTIRKALELLGNSAGVRVAAISRLRETDPVGLVEQPRFLNGACEVETTLSARALLDVLLEVERSLGRTRDGARHGPRTIDLDLLLYDGETYDEPGLIIPHPRLHERRFALDPLLELDPSVVVPGRGSVAALSAELHSPP